MSDTDLAFRCTLDGSGFASGMQNINSQLSDLGVRTNSATASLGPLGTLMGTLANPLTAAALGITAVGAAMAASVGAAAAWQTGMAGVQKTTGLSGEPLQALSQQLLDLSTTMPIASSELTNIAQVAGSLGVATGDIINFTQSAAMMAVAFEMPAEQAATMGSKILNAYKQPISSMQNLGNTVNALGDSFAATEPQILDFVNRASFLNTTFGQTIPQVAALGTVMISAGMDADLAATGIKSLLNIGLSEKTSGKGITAWADLLGVSVDQAKEKIATDLNGALVETADKIAAIEDPVKRFNTAVAIAGTEGAPALLKLAGQADNLDMALKKANGEWENGSSMMKTFEANSATLNSQMDIFWNTLNKAGVELGNVLLPHITKLVVGLTDAAKAAISLGEAIYGAMSSGYEVAKVGGSLDQWLYSATGGLLGTTPEMAEIARNAGTGTADEWANGLTGGISDSYAEIDGTMKDNLNKAGTAAGTEAGETTAEAWAKAQDNWWKANSGYVTAGYGQIGRMYDKEGNVITGKEGIWGSWTEGQSSSPIGGISTLGSVEVTGRKLRFTMDTTGSQAVYSLYDESNGQSQVLWTAEEVDEEQIKEAFRTEISGISPLEISQLYGEVPYAAPTFENLWEKWGSNLQESKWFADNAETIQRVGEQLGFKLYTGMGLASSQEVPELKAQFQEDMANVLKGIADPGSVSYEIFNASIKDLVDHNVISSEWAAEFQQAGTDSLKDIIVDPAKYLKTQMEDLGQEAGTALKDGLITVQEQQTLTELVDAYLKAGGDATDALVQAILAKDWAEVGRIAGGDAGRGFVDALTGEMRNINIPKLSDVLSDPNLQKNISNLPDFLENTFQPALKRSFDQQYAITKLGYDDSISQTTAWVESTEKIYSEHANWFQNYQRDLLNMYAQGRISAENLMWIWDEFANKSTKTTDNLNKQAVGYNQLQKAMEDCAECAISDFGEWQESQENLFQGAYLGPGEGYLAWKTQQVQDIAATQRAMQAAGGAVLGKSYMESPLLSYQIDLDTSLAEGKLKTFQGDLQKPSEMAIDLKTDAADASKMALETGIESANPVMSVILETNAAYAAAANLAASISSLSPVVYVDVIPLISTGDLAAMISNAIGGSV